jgi:hypothetical protein
LLCGSLVALDNAAATLSMVALLLCAAVYVVAHAEHQEFSLLLGWSSNATICKYVAPRNNQLTCVC